MRKIVKVREISARRKSNGVKLNEGESRGERKEVVKIDSITNVNGVHVVV